MLLDHAIRESWRPAWRSAWTPPLSSQGLLGVDVQQLLREAGGPWEAIEQRRHCDDADPDVPRDPHRGWLFVGRGGPSVAIRVEPSTRAVTVGPAIGSWEGVASLRWRVGEPRTVLAPATFLDQLRSAVDAAAATKAPTLIVCRYCGALTAPEHALNAETCHACGSVIFGVVY